MTSWNPLNFGEKARKPGPFSSCARRSCAEPRDRIMHQDTMNRSQFVKYWLHVDASFSQAEMS